MKTEEAASVWIFDFALESESGEVDSAERPDQLMDVIVQWGEKQQLQVGGGHRAPPPDELEPGPMFGVDSQENPQNSESNVDATRATP